MRRNAWTGIAGGLTLLEVTVALLIGGMAVAGAAGLVSGLGKRVADLDAAARRADRDANADELLRELTENFVASGDSTPSFTGDPRRADFSAWCRVPAGWLSVCGVHLAIRTDSGGTSLILRLVRGDTAWIPIRTGVGTASLRYLVDPSHGGRWADAWTDRMPPIAMQVVLERDTLLLRVRSGE